MPAQPSHVYLDLDVVNNNFSASAKPPLLRFEETRNAPFLDGDSSDYFCSIIRFSLQTGNLLPVFIPKIDTTAVDPIMTTIYRITMVYKKTAPSVADVIYTATMSVMFVSSVPNISGPLPYNYYYIYNYVNFLKMVNQTLKRLMSIISALFDLSAGGVTYFAPFMEIDPSSFTGAITADKQLFVNKLAYVGFEQNPSLNLYFITSLHSMVSSLPCQFNSA